MNVWQYSRWVYLIGRSIKNKSLSNSEREAFVLFIYKITIIYPMILPLLNIKMGNSYKQLLEQNDYSLGKMLQVIGRKLKVFFFTKEAKKLCDDLFSSTDERRFMTYNKYQVSGGKNIFVTVEDDLFEIANSCPPNSVIILSKGEYNTDLNVSVDGTTIKSTEEAKIIGNVSVSANNVTIENISIKSKEFIFDKEDSINSIILDKINAESCIKIFPIANNFTIKNSVIYGCEDGCAITFFNKSNNVLIDNCKINGHIEFKDDLKNGDILNNKIFAEKGIILNGEDDSNINIEYNSFNLG